MRDTYVYHLIGKPDGVNSELVYIGISNNTDRRGQEHIRDGMQFDDLEVVAGPMTQAEAEKEEKNRLVFYRSVYGRNPRYNVQNS